MNFIIVGVSATLFVFFLVHQTKKHIGYPLNTPVLKLRENGTSAVFLRADGRLFRKFYDPEFGDSVGRSQPTLIPWGKMLFPAKVKMLRSELSR